MKENPNGQRFFRVLVAEDDKSQLRTLRGLLEEEGFEAIGCVTAEEAFRRFDRGRVDVAVVDLRLPDLSESVLLEKLGTFSEDVPIIIHTGHSSYESAKRAINGGAFAYVEKAGDPAELLRQVHRAVQNAEKSQRESEARYRELFDNMSSGVAVYEAVDDGSDFVISDFNKSSEQINHVKTEAVIGKRVTEAFSGVKEFGLLDVFQRVWRTGIPEHHPISLYTDERIAGWRENYVYKLPSGEVVAVYDDVTERKQHEEALAESKRRLDLALRSSNIGLFDWNVVSGEVFFSPEWKRQIGYRDDEIGANYEEWESLLHPDDIEETLRALQAYMDEAAPEYAVEFRLRHKDGSYRWVFAQGEALRDEQGKPVRMLGCHVDVTERKLLEEQLRHTHKMDAVGQLAAGVAHEFNNLLFGILGSAELILATQEGTLPEHIDRPLRDIKKCGRRGAALTKQLLSFARKKTPEVSQFYINQVVGELDSVLRQVGGERVTLEMDLAPELPPVEADRGEVEQAIMNLARNARDAMPNGGTLTIRTAAEQLDEARVSGSPHARPGPFVQLSVADTGCGMSPDTMDRVFEPFFTTKPVGKGTGLGLSTLFADVTKNGGVIQVESRQGQGTVFRVYLPAAEETVHADNENVGRSANQPPGGSETILVCDDDEVVLDSAAFLVEARGYSVVRALGARKALEAAESHKATIDLLLTDVKMPEMNGWELAQKLAEQRPDMKVIFMSGYAEDVLNASGAKGEHIEFLQKPPENDTLFRRIREVLNTPRISGP